MLAVVAGIVFGVAFGLAMLIILFIYKLRSANWLSNHSTIYKRCLYGFSLTCLLSSESVAPQVHGAHQAASHMPALYLSSRSRYSFTDPKSSGGARVFADRGKRLCCRPHPVAYL